MKKHPRQRGYFGDTVRKGASGPARPGKKNARRTDDEQTFVSVPGGLDAEEVLGLMGKIRHPVRLDDLIRFLDLSRRDKKPLENLLDALQAEGRVIRLRGGKWVEASQARIVTGVLSIQRSGAGFVTPDAVQDSPEDAPKPVDGDKRNRVQSRLQPDIFIHPGFLGDAWHGDRVEVALQPAPQHRGGKVRNPEGRIIRVLERRQKELAVHVTRNQTQRGVLCRPADPRLDFLLDVDVSALKAAPKIGELLLVTPEEKVEDGLWRGTARVSLGLEEDAMVQERLTKLNHEIPLDFPPNVLAEAAELEKRAAEGAADLGGLKPLDGVEDALPIDRVSKASTSKRQDLRGVPFVTIDGEDARDFDDAVYVRRLPGAPDGAVWELWVAIADVSHFVLPGSRLDREARDRGNSYYFPTSVEPMLPEVLSNGLCSLRPDEDRLVMAARVGFDDRGIPRTSAFFPGVIRSRRRLTYEGVQEALDHGGELAGRHPYLKDAEALAHLLLERRQARGSLDFDLPEAQFIVNRSTGEVEGIKRRVRLFAHRLIEEFMLAANEAVARFLTEKGTPFPYRIHPAPDPDRLSTLFRTLASTDLAQSDLLTLKRGETPSPSRLRDILVQANGTPQEYLVGRLVLRSMMQARYSPEAGEHFGLASPCYCHFTSPIRRYADLLVHRALSFTLGATPGPILAGHKLLMAADQCNARERAATEAEREIARRLGCLLLRERTGETFTGVVSGVTEFGFFVEFDEMPVEGMVRLTTFRDDWFEYDPDRQELIGVGTGRRFRLGQAVTVRLTDVHIGRLEVNLELERTTDTAKRSSSRRSAGGREAPGRSSGRKRNGFVPRHKRR